MTDYSFPSVHHVQISEERNNTFFPPPSLLFSIDNSSLPPASEAVVLQMSDQPALIQPEWTPAGPHGLSCGTQAWELHSSQGFYQCWVKWNDDFTDFIDYTHLACSRALTHPAYDMALWIYIWFAAHSIWRVLAVTSIVFPHPSFIRLFLPGSGSLHAPLPNCTSVFSCMSHSGFNIYVPACFQSLIPCGCQ